MARTLEDVGAAGSGMEGVYLSADNKIEVWQNAYPFKIAGAVPRREGGKYGDQTIYTIVFSSVKGKAPGWAANSEQWLLAFSANDHREGQATRLMNALAVNDDPIGPCYLSQYELKSGGFSWDVKGEPDDAAKRKSGSQIASTTPDPDDDIPF